MAHKGLLKDVILPHEVKYEKSTYSGYYAKFKMYPFDRGVGITVANSLRRVLLSSIPGYAISSIKIDGINHEFEPIPGVKEDLTDIILNIKKIKLFLNDGSERRVIRIQKEGKGELTAADFAVDNAVEVVNSDLKIATLNEDANLMMDVTIDFGSGYRSAEDAMDDNTVISLIPIDAIYSPVIKVNYNVEDYRVGEKTNCEKVVLDVWTDGTIDPVDAVSDASFILKKYFSLFIDFEEDDDTLVGFSEQDASGEGDVLSKQIDELDLSVRSYNCLKSAEITTIGELLEYDRGSLMKIKNFGKKSLTEIAEKLSIYNLSLQMGDEVEGDLEDEEQGDE